MIVEPAIIFGALGLLVTVLIAIFGDVRARIRAVDIALRAEMTSMSGDTRERAREGKTDRDSLWAHIRSMEALQASRHERLLERIGTVATRDDLAKERETFEGQLHALEHKLDELLVNSRHARSVA